MCPSRPLQVVLTSAKETSKRVEGADSAAAGAASKVRGAARLAAVAPLSKLKSATLIVGAYGHGGCIGKQHMQADRQAGKHG